MKKIFILWVNVLIYLLKKKEKISISSYIPLPYGYQQPVSSHEVKQLKNKTLKNIKTYPHKKRFSSIIENEFHVRNHNKNIKTE